MPGSSVDVKALNTTLAQAIIPLFWGTVALAVVVPIAAAGGTWVAEKITGGESRKKKGSYGYD